MTSIYQARLTFTLGPPEPVYAIDIEAGNPDEFLRTIRDVTEQFQKHCARDYPVIDPEGNIRTVYRQEATELIRRGWRIATKEEQLNHFRSRSA